MSSSTLPSLILHRVLKGSFSVASLSLNSLIVGVREVYCRNSYSIVYYLVMNGESFSVSGGMARSNRLSFTKLSSIRNSGEAFSFGC